MLIMILILMLMLMLKLIKIEMGMMLQLMMMILLICFGNDITVDEHVDEDDNVDYDPDNYSDGKSNDDVINVNDNDDISEVEY